MYCNSTEDSAMAVANGVAVEAGALPVGYKFRPTEEELLRGHLLPKLKGYPPHPFQFLPEIDLENHNPMQLQDKARDGEDGSYYFFTKNHQGMVSQEPERHSDGYWEATGVTESVIDEEGRSIGTKREFIYHFNLNNNDNTWRMHEYRLSWGNFVGQNQQQQWVLAKVENERQKQNFELEEELEEQRIQRIIEELEDEAQIEEDSDSN